MTKRPADGQGRKALAPSQDDDAKNGEEEELEEEEDEQEIIVLDTESLIIAMERVTVLFDRSVSSLYLLVFWKELQLFISCKLPWN